jgi:putative ABC transport system substrate-binding protein
MKRKITVLTLYTMLFALCVSAESQQRAKVPRIGYLSPLSPSSDSTRSEAFRQGLRERGYSEGQNIAVEYRYAEGNLDRLPKLAAELVRLKVDVIIAVGTAATRAAKNATATIPIVMPIVADPVASGLVPSLARPGGNITGFSTQVSELSQKRLELLKEAFPKVSRVAVLWNPEAPAAVLAFKETQAAASPWGCSFNPCRYEA